MYFKQVFDNIEFCCNMHNYTDTHTDTHQVKKLQKLIKYSKR